MPITLSHDYTLHLQFRDVEKCLLNMTKYGIKEEIASGPRKDGLEQNLDHRVINSPF